MSTQVICLYLFIVALSEFWLLLDIYLKFSQSKLQLASYKIMSEEPAGVESHLAGHKARAPGRVSNFLLVSIFLFYTPCILPEVCSSFRAELL